MTDRGSLIVVGTGYRAGGQITPEVDSVLRSCDHVFYLVTNPVTAHAIRGSHPRAESLARLYEDGLDGMTIGPAMAARITARLAPGVRVCAAFEGHAAIFSWPALEAIRLARAAGSAAQMLPGVSALDCLYADLGIDPGAGGCQLFEATDYIIRRRTLDTTTPLILLQAGVPGRTLYRPGIEGDEHAITILAERLLEAYPADHEVVIYELAQMPMEEPRMERARVADIPSRALKVYSTLFVPAVQQPPLDTERLAQLGLALVEGRIVTAHQSRP